MSREGLVLDVNQSGLDMSGFEKQELIGLVVKDMCVSPEEHRELVTEVIREGSVKDYEIQKAILPQSRSSFKWRHRVQDTTRWVRR